MSISTFSESKSVCDCDHTETPLLTVSSTPDLPSPDEKNKRVSSLRRTLAAKAKIVQSSVVAANDARRRVESNLAAVMMVYILVFLICHLPRLMLNIHELGIIR